MYFYSKVKVLSTSRTCRLEVLFQFSPNQQLCSDQNNAQFVAKPRKRLEEFILQSVDGIIKRTGQFNPFIRHFGKIYV